MFTTTELSQRVFLTVLHLLLLGNHQLATAASLTTSVSTGSKQNDSVRDERVFRSVPLTKPAEYRSAYETYPVSRFESASILDRRNGMSQGQGKGMATVVSSGSFTVDPEKAGSSILINAKPVPFNLNNHVDSTGFKNALDQAHRLFKKKGDSGYGYQNPGSFNDCFFGKNCPLENPIDDWRTYYSVLNGMDKQFAANSFHDQNHYPFNRRHGFGDDEAVFPMRSPAEEHSAFPFTVSGHTHYRNHHTNYPLRRYPDTIRRTRTTTPSSSPEWIKLEPVPPAVYDPFMLAKMNQSQNDTTSQFASRVGVELNPDSFAERHGWKEGKFAPGTRLPSWLEELNYQHGGLGQRPVYEPRPEADRNDEKWVKLEAVPVAGVSISKWVPKGTQPADLPSTNWPDQNNKPTAWWDRMDNFESDDPFSQRPQPPRQRPQYSNEDSQWGNRYTQGNKHHHSSSGWDDVIYPDNNPVSATATWDSEKGGSPGSWSGNYNSNKNSGRYPTATWSAPGSKPSSSSNNAHAQYLNSYLSTPQRRPSYSNGPVRKPPFYPDPNSLGNDPRWVLVSSSKGPPAGPKKPNINYDPDFPYPFQQGYGHRHSKDMNLTNLIGFSSTHRSGWPLSQDELFRRTNATLSLLKPALGQKQPEASSGPPPLSQALVDIIAQTGANVVVGSTEKYFNMDRIGVAAAANSTSDSTEIIKSEVKTPPKKQRQFLGGINPVYAAVGVGMIPATLAAVLPVALGRKKRQTVNFHNSPIGHLNQISRSDAIPLEVIKYTENQPFQRFAKEMDNRNILISKFSRANLKSR